VEVQVADLVGARLVLESLGYLVVFEYEKYRTTYELDGVELMLDELPYGDFVELEGDPDGLKHAAHRLDYAGTRPSPKVTTRSLRNCRPPSACSFET